MIAAKLDATIKAVCPIEGVSIGRRDDKATWRIDFKPKATQPQKDAAQAVLDAFDPVAADIPPPKEETVADLKAALIAKGVITQAEIAAVMAK
mgnify:CR=1 FL=1